MMDRRGASASRRDAARPLILVVTVSLCAALISLFVTEAPSVSSLLLQASLRIHQLYLLLFVAVTIVLFIYKGVMLPYPPTGAFSWEMVLLVLYYCVASTRLFQASKGNQTHQVGALLLALVLAMPLVVCQVFFLQLQTYVLRLDWILNGIALSLICAESLLCLLTLLSLLGRASL